MSTQREGFSKYHNNTQTQLDVLYWKYKSIPNVVSYEVKESHTVSSHYIIDAAFGKKDPKRSFSLTAAFDLKVAVKENLSRKVF